VNTVRVVNSPRIWDNQLKEIYRSKHFVRAYLVMALFVALVLSIGLDLRTTKQPHNVKTDSKKTLPATVNQSDRDSFNELAKELMPEQDDPSVLLLQILATPPPPPPANCQVDACLALTFDDGPEADSTPIILDALVKARVQATFFLIGYKVAPNVGILQRMHKYGNEIGNHSWTHPPFTKLSPARAQQQIEQTQAAITDAGVPVPFLFRPPYGSVNQAIAEHINMPVILWNVDPKDWDQKDPNVIADTVIAQAKPGAIIVMHDKLITAAAMDRIIASLRDHYRLVTVSQLLNLNPDSRGIYIGR